ncbi:MAG: orotate phosphoribosyltransferase [Actinobacteria bacterium]|nr:orotate phosphoribosyltransferase [Actinomycetota bacterium]
MSTPELIDHLRRHALRTDGPFTLRSGAVSSWYLDARQTTFDGEGARLVGRAVLDALAPGISAVGGMTMGADPIAVATAITAAAEGRHLRAFSVRKEAKTHGTQGRLVGPVRRGDRVTVLEDTTTTGAAAAEAVEHLSQEGLEVAQVVVLVDRSQGMAGRRFADLGIDFVALVAPAELGVES